MAKSLDVERTWAGLSFDERALVIEVALRELCDEEGLAEPIVHVLDGPGPKDERGLEALGRTLSVSGDFVEITIYGGSWLANGKMQIDDPWTTLDTTFHEFEHSYRVRVDPEHNGSRYEPEINKIAHDEVAEVRRRINHGEDPFPFNVVGSEENDSKRDQFPVQRLPHYPVDHDPHSATTQSPPAPPAHHIELFQHSTPQSDGRTPNDAF